jgi:uncharacterized radical SAM protein YgiQ
MMGFLATTKDELKGKEVDIIIVTGDAYVDHPSFGAAIIGRVLEKAGYNVGIISMPDWKNPEAITVLGKPRLFFGVTSGNVDSMLNLYTAFKKRRSDDPYVPGGVSGREPEHALINYCNLIKATFKDVPIVIGGIEASMRRLIHYDFWDNRLRRSIIEDSRADILAYGMAETAVVEIADRMAANKPIEGIPGTLVIERTPPENAVPLPCEEESMNNPDAFLKTYRLFYENQDRILTQQTGSRFLVYYPRQGMSQGQIDAIYDLPFMYAPHPSYKEPIPAFDMIFGSINAHRGCVSGCSFCSVGLHQGKKIISRSPESILDEAHRLTGNKIFRKHVKDIGGPSANMYGYGCKSKWRCSMISCIHPELCRNLEINTMPWIKLLGDAARIKGVSRVTVGSGIRYDLLMRDKDSLHALRSLIKSHISGQLKIAPEHTVGHVLRAMRKTPVFDLKEFAGIFKDETGKILKKQYLLPYLMSCHPGCSTNDMLAMKKDIQTVFGFLPKQVQAFIPLPMTLSSVIYFTGVDPLSGDHFRVDRNTEGRRAQHDVIVKKVFF